MLGANMVPARGRLNSSSPRTGRARTKNRFSRSIRAASGFLRP